MWRTPALFSLLVAATPVPRIADLHPIILRDGVNTVPHFLPGGSSATIVQAWRANGNAHDPTTTGWCSGRRLIGMAPPR